MGGFSSMVLHYLMQSGQLRHGINIDSMVLPDRFIDQASPAEMYSDAGMSEGHVIDRCTKLLHKGLSIPENHTDTVNIQSS